MSGDSRFYFAPMVDDGVLPVGFGIDTGDLETITVSAGSTICEPDPTGDASIPSSGTGKTYAVADTRGMTVRIRCALGNDSDLAESFMAMVSHAKAGGVVGFALDTDFVWAVQLESDILRGDSDFDYPTSFVEEWEGITDPEVGWKCHAQSPLPQLRRETIKLDGVAADNATLDGSFVFALATQGQNVLVRHKFFFPFLRYLGGDVLLTEPTGGVYVFDCVFEVDVGLEHIPVETESTGHVSDDDTLVLLKMENLGLPGAFTDSSSYARTISTNGTVTQTGPAAYYGDAGGDFGGTNSDFLSWADAAEFNLGTGDFTIEGWARTPSASTYQCLFWMGDSNQETRRFLVYVDGPNTGLRWYWKDGSPILNNHGSDSVIVADTWFHWCIQREGANSYMHINGVNIDTSNVLGSHSMRDWTGALRLGKSDLTGEDTPWLGEMDDFRFSNVARYGSGTFTP